MRPRSRPSCRRFRPPSSVRALRVMAGAGSAIHDRQCGAGPGRGDRDAVRSRYGRVGSGHDKIDTGSPEQGGPFRVRDTTMNDDLDALKTSTDAALADAADLRAWDAVRIAVLGRNGSLTLYAARPRQDIARPAQGPRRGVEPIEGRADIGHRGAEKSSLRMPHSTPDCCRNGSIRHCRRGRGKPA